MARPVKAGEEATAFAELALCRRLHKSAVKKLLKEQYKIGARTAETVISRARERILERTAKGLDLHRQDAYAFYDSIIRDSAAGIRMKLLAQERIDKLLGLERPDRLELSGPGGGAIQVSNKYDLSKLPVDELRRLRETLAKAKNQ